MAQHLLLDLRVPQAPHELVGHHVIHVARLVLACAGRTLHNEVTDCPLTTQAGGKCSSSLLSILTHPEKVDNVHQFILCADCKLLHGEEQRDLCAVVARPAVVHGPGQLLGAAGPELVHCLLSIQAGGSLVSRPVIFEVNPVRLAGSLPNVRSWQSVRLGCPTTMTLLCRLVGNL